MTQQPNRRNSSPSEQERVERAYHQSAGRYNRRRAAARQRRNSIIAICAAVATLICVIIVGILLFSNNDDGLILKGVKVAGVDVGGMNRDEAIEAVSSAVGNTYSQKVMIVKVLEESTLITPADSSAKLDVEAAVDAAIAVGRTGSASQKNKDKKTAESTGYIVDIIPALNLDTRMIQKIIENLGTNYSSTLVNSDVTIDYGVYTTPQKLIVTVGVPEYTLDLEVLYQQVLTAYRTCTFTVEGKCSIAQPDPIDLDALYQLYYKAPVNGYLDPDTSQIISSIPGYHFDLNDAKARLDSAKPGEEFEIAFIPIEGTEFKDFPHKLAEVTLTQADSEPGRIQNLKRACSLINGTILTPGQKFSYNDALGERNAANGYAPGPSYSNGQTVYTYGGGICQVSSALYQCCLYADLKVNTRSPHGYLPSYAEGGQDAMVNWDPKIDFIFTNDSGYNLRIEAFADDFGGVTVRLYGTDDKTYTVELKTETISVDEIAVQYDVLPEDNEWGYKDGDVIDPGYAKGSYRLYIVMVDKTTGKRTEREVGVSNYNGRPMIICQIQQPEPEPEPEPTPEPNPESPEPNPEPGIPGSGGGIEEA